MVKLAGVVTVQVNVPPALPELLHWLTTSIAGPPLGSDGGVLTQVTVFGGPTGLSHCVTVPAAADPAGKFVRLLVIVTVQVTVAAPLIPESLHCVTDVTGTDCDVMTAPPVSEQAGSPVQLRETEIVVASSDVPSAAKVTLFVIVTTQVTVAAPDVPAPLHWLMLVVAWAFAVGVATRKDASRIVLATSDESPFQNAP